MFIIELHYFMSKIIRSRPSCKASRSSVCHYYNTARGCWYGDNCRFRHDDETNRRAKPQPQPQTKPQAKPQPRAKPQPKTRQCRYYRLASGCRKGESCPFLHGDQETQIEKEMEKLTICIPSVYVMYNEEKPDSEGQKKGATCMRAVDTDRDPDLSVPHGGKKYEKHYSTSKAHDSNNNHHVYDEEDDDEDQANASDVVDYEGGGEACASGSDQIKGSREDRGERERPKMKKIKCGECGAVLIGEDAFDLLWSHYLEKLRKFDSAHVAFLNMDKRLKWDSYCSLCKRGFDLVRDFLRHLVDKSKRDDADGEEHLEMVESGIVEPFCYRDAGEYDEEELIEELVSTLVNEEEENECDREVSYFEFLKYFNQHKKQMAHKAGKYPGGDDDDDNDDDSDDGGMCGFTADECNELLCQGVKPWDDDAFDVLMALNDSF